MLPFGAVVEAREREHPVRRGREDLPLHRRRPPARPVASVPPQPPAASGPVGNGGENRSMRQPDDWATYTRPCASTATAPAVPRSVASLQKLVDALVGVRVGAGRAGEGVVGREPHDQLAVGGAEALEARPRW